MNKELILASGSPRRKELLQQLHIPFSVHVSNVDEKVNHNYSPSE
ncbi:Maf family protein, partial [Escherichia coli]|nr:Maf family protein [Escherichia coli]